MNDLTSDLNNPINPASSAQGSYPGAPLAPKPEPQGPEPKMEDTGSGLGNQDTSQIQQQSKEYIQSGIEASGVRAKNNLQNFSNIVAQDFSEGTTMTLLDIAQRKYIDYADAMQNQPANIKPEDFKTLYPDVPVPNQDVTPAKAKYLADDWNLKRAREQMIMNSGPAPVLQALGGLEAGLVDPANILAGYGLGAAFGAASLLPEGYGVAAKIANNAFKTAAVVAEGAVFGAGSEALSYYNKKEKFQPLPTDREIVGNVEQQAMLGVGIHFMAQGVAGAFSLARDYLKGLPEDIQRKVVQENINQIESGAKPDGSRAEAEAARRVSVNEVGTGTPMHQGPVLELPFNEHYVGVRASGDLVKPETNLGPGVQTSANKKLVNNLSADFSGGGKIGTLKMPPDLKLFDLDQLALDEHQKTDSVMKMIEKEFGVELKPETGESIHDVIDRMHDQSANEAEWQSAMGRVNNLLRDQGYNGFKFHTEDTQGNFTGDATHLFLKDNLLTDGQTRLGSPQLTDERINPTPIEPVDQKAIPQDSPDEKLQAYQDSIDPKNSTLADPDLDKLIRDSKHEGKAATTPEAIDQVIADQTKNALDYLNEIAKDDPELKAEIDEVLKQEDATDKQQQGALQTLVDCVAKGLV